MDVWCFAGNAVVFKSLTPSRIQENVRGLGILMWTKNLAMIISKKRWKTGGYRSLILKHPHASLKLQDPSLSPGNQALHPLIEAVYVTRITSLFVFACYRDRARFKSLNCNFTWLEEGNKSTNCPLFSVFLFIETRSKVGVGITYDHLWRIAADHRGGRLRFLLVRRWSAEIGCLDHSWGGPRGARCQCRVERCAKH